MEDPVHQAAQVVVDRIDREVARLLAARETVVKAFGLGVKLPSPPELPELRDGEGAPDILPPPLRPYRPEPPEKAPETPPELLEAFKAGRPPVFPPGSVLAGDKPVFDGYVCDPAQERRDNWRLGALHKLAQWGRTRAWQVRSELKIPAKHSREVLNHQWFDYTGQWIDLTEMGRAEAASRGLLERAGVEGG